MPKTLQQVADDISDIHGALAAHDAFVFSLVQVLGPEQLKQLAATFNTEIEAAQTALLSTKVSDRLLASLTQQANRHSARLAMLLAKT